MSKIVLVVMEWFDMHLLDEILLIIIFLLIFRNDYKFVLAVSICIFVVIFTQI